MISSMSPTRSSPDPIIAFPGNHDGDPLPGDTSLAGFMANFCDGTPMFPLPIHSSSSVVTPRRFRTASGRLNWRR